MLEFEDRSERELRQIGRRTPRREDGRLLRGTGAFLDDLDPPHALHMAVGRSPFPYARIASIDVSAALELEGVRHVLVGSEVVLKSDPLTLLRPIKEVPPLAWYALAVDVALFEGQPVVSVAATSRHVAEDALELVDIDYEPLAQLVDVVSALDPASPVLHDGLADNLLAVTVRKTGEPELALAAADVVVEALFEINRVTALPMEGRGVIAEFIPGSAELLVHVSTQVPHLVRKQLAEILRLDEGSVRVIAPMVGGGFGLKLGVYPEDLIASIHAMATGRPVKWVEDRIEHFRSSTHAREATHSAKIGANEDGQIQVLCDTHSIDMGAYHSAFGPPSSSMLTLTGPYLVGSCYTERRVVATNKTPVGAYRGYGAPESNFVCEVLIEQMAQRLGADPLEFRLANMIRPEQLPFETPSGAIYDGGDYPRCLELAAERIGYREMRSASRGPGADGLYRGVGLAAFIEKTGYPGSRWLGQEAATFGAHEGVTLRATRSGSVDLYSGITSFGQGGETAVAQVCSEVLGIALDRVHVHLGDTAASPAGTGSFSSRTMIATAGAVQQAAEALKDQILVVAAHLLDVEQSGQLTIRADAVVDIVSPSVQVSLVAVFEAAISGHDLPEGLPPGLEATAYFDPAASAYGSGAGACVVAVDAATGEFEVERFVLVHDCGTQVNPTLVEGQVQGGLAQAFGAALMEELLYDSGSGQMRNGTMMDYFAPTAADLPDFELDHIETASPVTPFGIRGVGEAGTIAPAAAITNAICHALSEFGVVITQLPLTAERVWRAIVGAREAAEVSP
jgi:carbon-monoxide dehydrogenase large subunit